MILTAASQYNYNVTWGFIYEEKFAKKELKSKFGIEMFNTATLTIEKPYEKKIGVRKIETYLLSIINSDDYFTVKFFVPDEFYLKNDQVTRGDRRLFTNYKIFSRAENTLCAKIGGPLFFKCRNTEVVEYTRFGDIEDVSEMVRARLIEFTSRIKAYPLYYIEEIVKSEIMNIDKLEKKKNCGKPLLDYKLKALNLLTDIYCLIHTKREKADLHLRDEYPLQEYLKGSSMFLDLLVKEKIEEFYVIENKLHEKCKTTVDKTIKLIKSDVKERTKMGYETLNIMAYIYSVVGPLTFNFEYFRSNGYILNGQRSLENNIVLQRGLYVSILDSSGRDAMTELDIEILFYKKKVINYGMQTTYTGKPFAIPLKPDHFDYECPVTIDFIYKSKP